MRVGCGMRLSAGSVFVYFLGLDLRLEVRAASLLGYVVSLHGLSLLLPSIIYSHLSSLNDIQDSTPKSQPASSRTNRPGIPARVARKMRSLPSPANSASNAF